MGKSSFIALILTLFSIVSYSQQKRGMAYGNHSETDLAVLSPPISWWYNWSEVPENAVKDVFGEYGFEFVPMTWNGNFNETKLRTFLTAHPETKYLLAFNEPNFLHQANMTPSQAVAMWPTLEAIADDFDLEIVGPAVNYCGECVEENGTTYYDPFDYLDDFFEACQGCRVDHIAVHSYMNSVDALKWYIGEFKKYDKPIWLTEFAGWEENGTINNVNDQINFMIGAVDFLENEPAVFRYAWFIGRADGIDTYPYIDLLGNRGVLTALGEVYKNMPIHTEDQVATIPGIMEVEVYNTMNGIELQRTSDQSGFLQVGKIDAGDWLEYKIDVDEGDSYQIQFRVASSKNSSLRVRVDGVIVLTQNFNTTGSLQSWSTVNNTLDLTGGEHTIRIEAITDGFNLNWIRVGDVITSIRETHLENQNLWMYPNPTSGQLFLEFEKPGIYSIRLIDVFGRAVHNVQYNQSTSLDVSNLQAGIYMLLIQHEGEWVSKKVRVK